MFKKTHQSAEDDMIEREGAQPISTGQRSVVRAAADSVSAVYFLAAVGTNLIKIGTILDARKIGDRINTLQAGCPFDLKLIFMLHGAGRSHERKLHARFARCHARGEWFRREEALEAFLDYSTHHVSEASRKIMVAMLD